MTSRVAATALIVGVMTATSSAAFAGDQTQQATPPTAEAPKPEPLQAPAIDVAVKQQVRNFEAVLRQSIDMAGEQLANWAKSVVPDVRLVTAAAPVAYGMQRHDSDLHFTVQVAEILPATLNMFQWSQMLSRPKELPTGTNRPSTTAGPAPPTGTGQVQTMFDPDVQYAGFVREALIGAMLDGSGILPQMQAGHWLTIVAIPVDVAVSNPLYKNRSRNLVLSLKSEDLQALRAGTITRDQARARIVESRF